MPRRRKLSDLEILIEFLLDIGEFIGKAIIFIFKCIFSLINSNKRGPSSESNNKHIHIEPIKPKIQTHWNLGLLNKLEWKRFEEVVSDYYRLIGYRSKVTRMGADGGVDVLLYQNDSQTPTILIQCKSWSKKVGVNAVRELYGVMASD